MSQAEKTDKKMDCPEDEECEGFDEDEFFERVKCNTRTMIDDLVPCQIEDIVAEKIS